MQKEKEFNQEINEQERIKSLMIEMEKKLFEQKKQEKIEQDRQQEEREKYEKIRKNLEEQEKEKVNLECRNVSRRKCVIRSSNWSKLNRNSRTRKKKRKNYDE